MTATIAGADPLAAGDRLEIAIGGAPPLPALAQAVVTATVRQSLAAGAVAELALIDPQEEAAATLRLGVPIRLGVAGRSDPLFEGRIVELAHEHDAAHGLVVHLSAEDALGTLARRQSTRAFRGISAVDLAATLAGEVGLTAYCAEAAPEHELVLQHEQSDLDLLCDVAAAAGLYPVLDGTVLKLVSLAGDGAEQPLRLGRDLIRVRVGLASARALKSVEVHAVDLVRNTDIRARAGLARQDREEMRDLGEDPPSAERHLLNRLARGDAQAEALAQAVLDYAASTEGSAEGVALGNPDLKPGSVITLEGVAATFVARYVLVRVVHSFSSDAGYVTEFSTAPPSRPPRAAAPAVTVALVIDTADPERGGRCRVALPSFGGVETGWMQVAIAGAGPGRGLAALPETGDRVLLVCPDGDPAYGIVLGGLYGTERLPRGLGTASPRAFVLRSAGGQALELSGRGGISRLSTSGGSLLELAPGRCRLAAASDLVIEAPGRTITIRAEAVNFERG